MDISYRRLLPADHRFAWELNQSEVPHVGTETFEELSRLCRISASAWIATAAEEPVAFLLGMTREAPYDSPNFLWFKERYPSFLYVDRLAVAASHRKLGIGAGLYARAEEDARREGLGVICCEVNLRPPNPTSLAFHERIGFLRAGEQEAHGKRVTMLTRPVG